VPKPAPRIALPKFALSAQSSEPLHMQIYRHLRQAVLDGTLASGSRLPSTRSFAEDFGISRTTVLAAYDQLLSEGYIEGRVGAGTRIARHLPDDLLPAPSSARRRASAAPRPALILSDGDHPSIFGPEFRLPTRDWKACFRLALPALDLVPFTIWARLVSKHVRRAARETIDYHDSLGLPRLRRAIAAHIAMSRGIACAPDQILICAGAQAAIDLVARSLLKPGDRALVEDPCHLGFAGVIHEAGAIAVRRPVDEAGMIVPRVSASLSPRLAFVTPSNQFPLAVTMSLARRLELLDWAQKEKAWIAEDDYDSEFRFDGRPVPALLSLDHGARVIYVGSFSKSLYPGLRLGFLVLPDNLVDRFVARRRFIDFHPPMLLQAALADFIEDGHFSRHIRRMRKAYGERAQALSHHVEKRAAGLLQLRKPEAGMHAIAWLPPATNDQAIARLAAQKGIEARALSFYGRRRQAPGLVLGFGTVTPEDIAKGVTSLSAVISTAQGRNAGGNP
jgi:GntR family transcriptional regulator/MocR family aminotransferase